MCLLMCCYARPAEEGRKALAPLLDALPGPWFNWMGEMPYPAGPVTRWTKAYWGAYPNFMLDDEGDARLKATYGDNYARLAVLKKKYDPANLFRVNQNILPSP
jgi:hypothetical protein